MQLRQSPSGPPFLGQNDGDLVIWNNTTREWEVGPGAGGETAWDVIVTDVSDLPPPVGGEIILPSGSYAFKNAIDIGTDRIIIPVGSTVLMKGMGLGKQITSSGLAPTITIEDAGAVALIESLQVASMAVGGGPALEQDGGVLWTDRCQFFGPDPDGGQSSPAILQTGGEWKDSLSRAFGGSSAWEMGEGSANLTGTWFLAATRAFEGFDGFAFGEVKATNVIFQSSGGDHAISLDSVNINYEFNGCTINNFADGGACINVDAAVRLTVRGGLLQVSNTGDGIAIDGNLPGGLVLVGVTCDELEGGAPNAFVRYISGTVNRATVNGCNVTGSLATALDFGTIPTNGLLITGNMFNMATPLTGFTAATAGVNLKACLSSAGLMTETAIV